MPKVLVVSHNPGKVKEFQAVLTQYQVLGLADLALTVDIVEDGQTYCENALKKVNSIVGYDDYIIVADDSGLEIARLNNRPGIYSARYLGEKTAYELKNQQILTMLKDETNRAAAFHCCIAVKIKGKTQCFLGELRGEIALAARGDRGFGYDPIFYLPTYQKTVAELSSIKKNEISHRAQALKQLSEYLKQNLV